MVRGKITSTVTDPDVVLTPGRPVKGTICLPLRLRRISPIIITARPSNSSNKTFFFLEKLASQVSQDKIDIHKRTEYNIAK